MTRRAEDFSTPKQRAKARAWACWPRNESRCRIRRRRRAIPWRQSHCCVCTITPVRLNITTKRSRHLEAFAGVAEQFGIFAATYGIAAVYLLESPMQAVVLEGSDAGRAADLYAAAVAPFAFNKSVLLLKSSEAVAENLPPALAATIANLPQLASGESFAVLCSGLSCQPPMRDATDLKKALQSAVSSGR